MKNKYSKEDIKFLSKLQVHLWMEYVCYLNLDLIGSAMHKTWTRRPKSNRTEAHFIVGFWQGYYTM